MPKKKLSIVGAGSAGLMLAASLDSLKFDVEIFDHNAAAGRKFLVAGDGGLNITHSEAEEKFKGRYKPDGFLDAAFDEFTNKDLISWLHQNKVETFTGSSGRVFPKSLKAIEVLNVFVKLAKKNGCKFNFRHHWLGFGKEDELLFSTVNEEIKVKPDLVVFCLGGASWPVTGSKGDWTQNFAGKGIKVNPFEASNSSFVVNWPNSLANKIAGKALKNIQLSCGDTMVQGEVILKESGIEGSGIYPLSHEIRNQLKNKKKAHVSIDLKPQLSASEITNRIKSCVLKRNFSEAIKKELHLSALQLALLKGFTEKNEFQDPAFLTKKIKGLSIEIIATGPVHDAISTVGGIDLSEIDPFFQIKKFPGTYAIGEMLDYDAPTGGYLLQSCFSMAMRVAAHLNNKA